MEGFRHGAAGYLLKPFNVTDLLTLVNQTLEKKRCLDYLRKSFLESPNLWGAELESTRAWQALKAGHGRLSANASGGAIDSGKESDMMALFSDLLDATDRQLLNHSSRVSGYASLIGTRLNLTDHEQRALTLGAFLHDIGKIRPTSTDVQGTRVRFSLCEDSFDQHPLVGARIVSALGLPSEVSQIVSCHHERWDGSGYPRRVRGERIPFLARIVGIAEAFDHLTGQLFGRAPLTIDDAILRISLESHTRFDPVLIDIFIEVLSKYKTSLPHMSISSPLESGEPQIVATVRATR